MALKQPRLDTFEVGELNFLAGEEKVTILPRQPLDSIKLAGWRTPRLRPLRRAEVPLWFAILLKKKSRCSIIWPEWLNEETLDALVKEEEENPDRFTPLPPMWRFLALALLKVAPDDCNGDSDTISQYLQALKEVRLSKVRDGLTRINESHMQMDNLGVLEVNEIRAVLAKSMSVMQKARDIIERG